MYVFGSYANNTCIALKTFIRIVSIQCPSISFCLLHSTDCLPPPFKTPPFVLWLARKLAAIFPPPPFRPGGPVWDKWRRRRQNSGKAVSENVRQPEGPREGHRQHAQWLWGDTLCLRGEPLRQISTLKLHISIRDRACGWDFAWFDKQPDGNCRESADIANVSYTWLSCCLVHCLSNMYGAHEWWRCSWSNNVSDSRVMVPWC